ncbi:MAG: universal stress protein [Nocardioides sp.]|nr:universal stress protein [Nocardioides sp.]
MTTTERESAHDEREAPMNQPENAIVVGVSSGDNEAVLAFAAEEALRTRCPLHLVHVLQLPASEAYAAVYDNAIAVANRTLDEAMSRVRALAGPDVALTCELVDDGWVVADLVHRGDVGRLMILEHRQESRVRRVFTGSVVTGVAARAQVPVVSVPEGWSATTDRPALVTAAVQDPQGASLILQTAFEEAQRRGAPLVVLHAWWIASGYDVVVVDQTFREQWSARFHEEITPVMKALREEFPDVEVTVTVRHAPPVEAVLDAAQTSAILVIGRRHHLLPLRTHLGPVARAVLGHSGCPVLVTPEVPRG